MEKQKITIAVIGLGFGGSFAEIYAHHPNVEKVVVVDATKPRITALLDRAKRDNIVVYDTFEDVLADPSIDAVQVSTGIPSHTSMTLAVLNAGKHCACAVPMATSLEDIRTIVNAVRASGRNYMMLETDLYGAPYLMAKEMLDNGELGKIQHMRGVHYQPMDDGYWNTGVTNYWHGLPPMHYATHAIAPLYGLAGCRINRVACMGNGSMSAELMAKYDNPYPVEDALISFENGLSGEVVRGLFECSATPSESFNVYGSKKTFWNEYASTLTEKFYDEAAEDKAGYNHTELKLKNYYRSLPEELHRFTIYLPEEKMDQYREHLDTAPLRGHRAAEPHLCHEFVMSIVEGRRTSINEDVAANITAAGVCAHISAMAGGALTEVPLF